MYEKTFYVPKISENIIGGQIPANHGIAQGKISSCNIFSFYISDMKDSVKDMNVSDFTELNNMLQLSDDTLIISDHTHSLTAISSEYLTMQKESLLLSIWIKLNTCSWQNIHPYRML